MPPAEIFDEADLPVSLTGGAVTKDASRIVNDNAPSGIHTLAERHRSRVDNCDGELVGLLIIPLVF